MSKFFKLLPHGKINKVLPNIYTIDGTMRFAVFQYSRIMTILNDNGSLALINPVRVNEEELSNLRDIGRVDHIFKIGALHNVDIPFYMDAFKPKLWVTQGDEKNHGFKPDYYFDDNTTLPILNAKTLTIKDSKIPETLLFTSGDGGCLHSCDAFVNMAKDARHNWLTAQLSKLLADPTYIGPNWIKMAKPSEQALRAVLQFDFEHFIPAHGAPLMNKAKEKIAAYIDNFYRP